jgi:hypothetical protein
MEINCEQIVEEYLLNKNPLYSFSFPISLLLAIIVFGISKARKWSTNSYINQILIPVLTFLLTMVVIDIISRMMVSGDEKAHLIQKCKIWMHDPEIRNHPLLSGTINMDMVVLYDENASIDHFNNMNDDDNIEIDYDNEDNNEHFTIQDNEFDNKTKYNDIMKVEERVYREQQKNYNEDVEEPICEIKNISPQPIKLKYEDDYERCVGGNTHDYNLCSGPDTGSNPMHFPVPGPQWLPQSAETVQARLANNDYWG